MSESSRSKERSQPKLHRNGWAIACSILAVMAWGWMFLIGKLFHPPCRTHWLKDLLDITRESAFDPALVMAIASVICGLVGRCIAGKGPKQIEDSAATVGLALSIFLGCLLLIVGSPPPPQQTPLAAACVRNLKGLATAITLYSYDDPLRRTPISLEALVNGTYLPKEDNYLDCPKNCQRYVYLASNQVWQSNSADIAVRCPGDHRGKVNVLFLDGRVAAITPAALTNAMATTNNVAPVQPVTR